MKVNNITKKYGDKVVLDNFSYDFKDGQITVILGESGVGKTTLLNILAGLDKDKYSIEKRTISYVFQNDRLLPNLTIEDNIKLVCKDIDTKVVFEQFDLKNASTLYPSELSAGMSRRVSIIRALYYRSDVLLMDEPFRNLDYYLKYKIMDIIKGLQKKNNNTIIMVTHDIAEAVYMADNIILLDSKGEIVYKTNKITKNTEKEILDKFLNK